MKPHGILIVLGVALGCAPMDIDSVKRDDILGALEIFQSNINSIHRRDTESYLAHYLESPELVVAGGDSLTLGFIPFAEARRSSQAWPDTLIAGQPTMVWISPGVVYGAYPYTVVVEGDTTMGWSERVFVKTGGGWKIAVTSVIQRVPDDS